MRIVTNEKLIRRNAKVGQIVGLISLLILGVGLVISLTHPEWGMITLSALIFGFLLSQIGLFFGNRWARRPRLDELLNQALKGLSREYTLYHYTTPAYHLLVGPAGIWVIVTKYQRGRITYHRGRWRQHGGPLLWYLRLFAQEGIGRPDLEIKAETEAVEKLLRKHLPEEDVPPVEALLVFTHPEVQLEAEEAPVPTLHLRDLKKFLKPRLKSRRLSPEQLQRIRAVLEGGEEGTSSEETDGQ
ncbi:MAG TPA: NERD domain-containing protein [Anaerolineae bacterium]|nr:NERD domain-containing protein [Anaerolineae bacterium]HID83715.1 NERD domain-containing protein [Anaerolineales bacterium]HIQ09876.1 NERD domain-containing protein [Anaerolineaceae bacterium]